VLQAQGKGCGPGVLGVCIGGDRATGYELSKTQFLRLLDDRKSRTEAGRAGAGYFENGERTRHRPDGFWRQDDVAGREDLRANRVPASYFVSVSYMCWAFRRQGVTLDADGKIGKWLY